MTLLSDGNAKNSIYLHAGSENLVYEKNEEDVYNLDDFLVQCAVTLTGTSLFQNYEKPVVNMFKLPLMLSKKISNNKIRNREGLKKSNFTFTFDLTGVDLNLVTEIFSSGRFDLLKSRRGNLSQMRELAREIKIPRAGKLSKIMIQNIIFELFNMIVAGRGNCHHYVQTLGETGGWTDDWCPHSVKYGAKMMVLMESCVDPADLYLSMKYPPFLKIMDDPCTFINHLFGSEKAFANQMFGPNRGCFQPPHKTEKPITSYNCPDILPLSVYPRKMNENLLENPTDANVHPITQKVTRLVLGTKLSESHKTTNECLFHNINNCNQASCVKTMSQEGLQVRRKSKRVTPGKRQSFESHFCFNFLMDILENQRTRRKQEITLRKHGEFLVNKRTLVAEFKKID